MAEITAALVKELRERTGQGMMDCKKALTAAGGDIENANPGVCKAWVGRHPPTDPNCGTELCIECCHGRRDFWLPHLPLCGATRADAQDFDTKCVAACRQ